MDVIFVSENVGNYIGLSQVAFSVTGSASISNLSSQMELMGQEFGDYIHPCDHPQLRKLHYERQRGHEDEHVELRGRPLEEHVEVRGRTLEEHVEVSGLDICES